MITKPSEALYAMAEWIREHRFSPHETRCFAAAAYRITARPMLRADAIWSVQDIVGVGLSEDGLRAHGWNESATKDAIAACEIAGDIAAAEGN